jgi:uncharacterized protein with PIN domain
VLKLILTRELGRLAKWLRILGLDAQYFAGDNSGSLIIEALRSERIILTRNSRLPQARGVKIVLLKEERIKAQLAEVLKSLKFQPRREDMFTRCIICNEELAAAAKEKVKDRVPEYVFKTQEDFVSCPKCQRVYWQGTHWGNVTKTLSQICSS